MPGPLSFPEIMIILAVLLLLFGAKRLPEMGKSLGRGMREFKDAVTGKDDDDERAPELPEGARTTAPAPPPAATTTPPAAPPPSETERVS
jgi:sec-independent protein translocase protein TatA